MKRICCLLIAGLAVSAGLLYAADFWEKKKFTTWSEDEVSKILKDSPWARRTYIKYKTPKRGSGMGMPPGGFGGGMGPGMGPGAGPGIEQDKEQSKDQDKKQSKEQDKEQDKEPSKEQGEEPSKEQGEEQSKSPDMGMPPGGFGGGMGMPPGGFGGGMGMPMGGSSEPIPIIVRWHSALPVKQAVACLRFKDKVGTSEEAAEMINREESLYIVGIISMPGQAFMYNKDMIKAGSQLIVEGKPPIQAVEVITNQNGQDTDLYVAFPRSQNGSPLITLKDKNVMVMIDGNFFEVKKKFSLKEMLFQEKLEF